MRIPEADTENRITEREAPGTTCAIAAVSSGVRIRFASAWAAT